MSAFYSVDATMHHQLMFCMVATLMVHPRIMKIHKNIPGDIPNIFLYQNIILALRNFKKMFVWIMEIHKNLPGDTPNDFAKFRGDWMYGY